MFPMSFADFSAKGWEYYDPSAGDAWDYEVQAGLYSWRYFSKDDIKALRVYAANPTDSTLNVGVSISSFAISIYEIESNPYLEYGLIGFQMEEAVESIHITIYSVA